MDKDFVPDITVATGGELTANTELGRKVLNREVNDSDCPISIGYAERLGFNPNKKLEFETNDSDYLLETRIRDAATEEPSTGWMSGDQLRYGKIVSENTNEIRTTSPTGGEKGVKPERYDLIPVEALDIMAKLYGFGAKKYAAHNWRKGYEWSKSYASLMRHATRFWAGEDLDEETQLPHLAGVAFHAFALMVFMQEFPEYDDRFSSEDAANLKRALGDFKTHYDLGVEDIDIEFPDPNKPGDPETEEESVVYGGTKRWPLVEVIPISPSYSSGRITIPKTTGVVYTINNVVVTGDVFKGVGTCLVEAQPLEGARFPESVTTEWMFA